jgi:hypothetical protein
MMNSLQNIKVKLAVVYEDMSGIELVQVNFIDIYIAHSVEFIIMLISVHNQTQHIIVYKLTLYRRHVSAYIFRPHTNVRTDHWSLHCNGLLVTQVSPTDQCNAVTSDLFERLHEA